MLLPSPIEVKFDRKFIRKLYETYAPNDPLEATSIGAAQDVCEQLGRLYRTGHYAEVIKHFILDHMVETNPSKDLKMHDIKLFERHGNRLLGMIRGPRN